MPLEHAIALYAAGFVIALAGYAMWNDRRRRGFGLKTSQDVIFRCIRCGSVYTDDPDIDRSRCPHCGTTNDPFEF